LRPPPRRNPRWVTPRRVVKAPSPPHSSVERPSRPPSLLNGPSRARATNKIAPRSIASASSRDLPAGIPAEPTLMRSLRGAGSRCSSVRQEQVCLVSHVGRGNDEGADDDTSQECASQGNTERSPTARTEIPLQIYRLGGKEPKQREASQPDKGNGAAEVGEHLGARGKEEADDYRHPAEGSRRLQVPLGGEVLPKKPSCHPVAAHPGEENRQRGRRRDQQQRRKEIAGGQGEMSQDIAGEFPGRAVPMRGHRRPPEVGADGEQ